MAAAANYDGHDQDPASGYFLRTSAGEFWMLMAYAKTVQGNIPAHVLRQIRKENEDG